jgi:putative ABC transport system permease protein
MPPFRRLFHLSVTKRSVEQAVDDEMRFHLQMRVEELMQQGRPADESRRAAIQEYGDINAARAEIASIDHRSARRGAWREWFSSVGQDIRVGLRGLRARPGFALTVLFTLALGIGANAAIFSVIDAVLLRPLPYAQPDRLVHLWETFDSKVDTRSEASYPDYLDWRTRNRVFTDLGGYYGGGFLLGGAQPMMISGAKATANFFDVLGVRAAVGRTFAAGEDAVNAPRVAVISFGFWMRQFGGDRSAIGRMLTVNGAPVTVIGVLPADFQFARQGAAELWVPNDRSESARRQRGNHWLNIVARLKPGVTRTQASQDLSRIMRALAAEYPESNAGRDGSVVPLQDELVGSVRPILLLLYGAVLVVLLIACVNVANLLLIRGADRQREIAVRVALGAGTGRLIRQLLSESLILAVVGGVLGLGVAKLGVHSLAAILPNGRLRGVPTITSAGIDPQIIIYALLVSMVAGVVFGLFPALQATRGASAGALKSAGRGSIGGSSALRDGLVVGEIALTVLLLSGAVLFGRSLTALLSIDPGFRADHVITGIVVFPSAQHPDAQSQVAAFRRLTDRVRSIDGVKAAGLVSKLPLDFGNSLSFDIVGQPIPQPGREPTASYRTTDEDYFRAMGIPLLSGRAFGAGDDATAPLTVVVNRALVKAYLGGVDPIGQRFFIFGDTGRVIGVVGDVPIGGIEDRIPPTVYVSFWKNPQTAMAVAIRTSDGVDQATRALRASVAAVDPSAAVTQVTPLQDLVAQSPSVFLRRLPLYLIGAFALTALLLAVVGIYGVVSYSVQQRTREMGIRLALGAQPSSLISLVMRHGGWMAGAGIVVGSGSAILLGRFAASMLYGIRSTDPLTYGLVALVLAFVAVGATILPARRATRVDPALALRAD